MEDWMAVCKVKAKGVYKVSADDALQEEECQVEFVNDNQTMDNLINLSDPSHELEDLPYDDEAFNIDEPEFETDEETQDEDDVIDLEDSD
ncbi:hypothetical protein M5689_010847 [Euphorbia peplus]|nr:hypothetical protein M5689_010847 [Euphorbia peplus]